MEDKRGENCELKKPLVPKSFKTKANLEKLNKNTQKVQNTKNLSFTFDQPLLSNGSDLELKRLNKMMKEINGELFMRFQNGDSFSQFMGNSRGQYKFGKRIKGAYYYKNGDFYVGAFQGAFIHGYGVLSIAENEIEIVGTWNLGKIQGQCQVSYKNGDKYFGTLTNLKKNGRGRYQFSDGRKFIGNFHDGKANGKGLLFDKKGQIIVSGIWLNGQLKNYPFIH